MIDLQDKSIRPTLNDVGEYVKNPVFMLLCSEIKDMYGCNEKIEYSSCSWAKGWNIKFKKSGKTLCTIYPKEDYFTVMVVVGAKEKALAEQMLPEFTPELQDIYRQTKEGNGQRWLTVDLEDKDALYNDVLRLIHIRRNS